MSLIKQFGRSTRLLGLILLLMPLTGMSARAETGAPAFCYASARHAGTEITFPPFCHSIETALLRDGSFQFALETARRVHAELALSILPGSDTVKANVTRSSGNVLIDRSLLRSLRMTRFAVAGASGATFTISVALQPVENTPSVVYRLEN